MMIDILQEKTGIVEPFFNELTKITNSIDSQESGSSQSTRKNHQHGQLENFKPREKIHYTNEQLTAFFRLGVSFVGSQVKKGREIKPLEPQEQIFHWWMIHRKKGNIYQD